MNTRVVTISRQAGAFGDDVARMVAAALGFRLVDRAVVELAAHRAGVNVDAVTVADQAAPLARRILEAIMTNPGWAGLHWQFPASAPVFPMPYSLAHYRMVLDEVIRGLADEGEVVILGHGGQVVLGERRDTLKVLVTASPTMRLRQMEGAAGVDAREAAAELERADHEREAFFHHQYRVEWLSPALYDFCLNTTHLSCAQAARAVTALARDR